MSKEVVIDIEKLNKLSVGDCDFKGIAKLHPDDEYDYDIGRQIAYDHAVSQLEKYLLKSIGKLFDATNLFIDQVEYLNFNK